MVNCAGVPAHSGNLRIAAMFDNGSTDDANDWCVQMRRYYRLNESIGDEESMGDERTTTATMAR